MRLSLLAVVVGLLILAPSVQAKTLEELLVEKGVITRADLDSTSTVSPLPKVYWNDGTRIEFPANGFTMQVNTLLKNSYIYTDAPDGQNDTSSFDVRNARLVLSGNALNQEFYYKLEYDGALNRVLDGYITWMPCPYAELKLGQFKTAISRQFVNNSFKIMFPDASIASNYFNYGYQKGARLGTKLFDGEIVAGVALSNGNSEGEGPYATAVDAKNLLIGDLRWNALGKMNAYEESDPGFTRDPALSFGAAYAYSPQETKFGETLEKVDVNRVSADANLKYQGLGMNAEYFISNEDPIIDESYTTQGAYAQAGYFVTDRVELAGRWSMVDCDDGRGLGTCQAVDTYNQATGGINYYFWKYNLRAQAAYDYIRAKTTDDDSRNQSRYMFQLLGMF